MKTIKIEIVDKRPTATVRIFREFTKFEVEEAKQFIEDIIHGKSYQSKASVQMRGYLVLSGAR